MPEFTPTEIEVRDFISDIELVYLRLLDSNRFLSKTIFHLSGKTSLRSSNTLELNWKEAITNIESALIITKEIKNEQISKLK